MNKMRNVIVFDVFMVVLAIILLAPFALNINIFSGSVGIAIASVVIAAFMAYEFVKVNVRAYLTTRAEQRIALESGDVTIDDLKRTLSNYTKKQIVGTYAKHGLAELELLERKREQVYAAIEGKFAKDSLTWIKFTDVADLAMSAVVSNTSMLARRIQNFDVDEYLRIVRQGLTGIFSRNAIPTELRQEKRRLYEDNVDDMRGIVAANEKLLLELDRFEAEMNQLAATANEADNNRMLEEINQLIDETKYYR